MIPSKDEQHAARFMTAMCEHTPNKQGVCTQCGGLRGDDGTYEPPLSRPLAYLCSICFAVPGVECNKAPGWFGAIKAGPHVRTPLENACAACRGSGRLWKAGNFVTCSRCNGQRTEPESR